MGLKMLSILIPNHQEKEIHEVVDEIEKLNIAHEIIISKDSESKGKGWALKEAFNQSRGDIVAFIDGDKDIEPRMFYRLIPFLEDFPIVVGSKRITQAPIRRKIMTHLTRIWFRFLFGVYVDTQTGIKIFRREALEALHNGWDSNGYVFDLEIISRLQKLGFKMVEVPIEVEIKKQLAFKTIFRIFMESLWLRGRLSFPAKR